MGYICVMGCVDTETNTLINDACIDTSQCHTAHILSRLTQLTVLTYQIYSTDRVIVYSASAASLAESLIIPSPNAIKELKKAQLAIKQLQLLPKITTKSY